MCLGDGIGDDYVIECGCDEDGKYGLFVVVENYFLF